MRCTRVLTRRHCPRQSECSHPRSDYPGAPNAPRRPTVRAAARAWTAQPPFAPASQALGRSSLGIFQLAAVAAKASSVGAVAAPLSKAGAVRPTSAGSIETTDDHFVRIASSAPVRGVRPSPTTMAHTREFVELIRPARCSCTASKHAMLSVISCVFGKRPRPSR